MVGPKFKGMEMRPGSMGKPAPGMDVRVIDNSGEEVNHGEEGNLGILCQPNKGPYTCDVCKTYSFFI